MVPVSYTHLKMEDNSKRMEEKMEDTNKEIKYNSKKMEDLSQKMEIITDS